MKNIAEDQFDRYYAEKIWEMIPAVYRHEDGIAENPGVLRALVEVIAQQAAVLRRSQDRLWEDQFIEWCSDWAIPYIADLVGTRMVSALNQRGRRVDVAKTIYYRRRKGTPRILEELISDISGWEGKVVENFQRLVRTRHGLDPHPEDLAGRLSGTLPGGSANLRRPLATEISSTPFDEFFHTPDFRKHRGQDGRYNIPKLGIHLFRLNSYPVREATPFSLDAEKFTFDPSGRDIPLFIRRNRAADYDWEQWHSALEWEIQGPIRCRLLGHAEYLISEAVVRALETDLGLSPEAVTDLRTLNGWLFRNESQLRAALFTLSTQSELLLAGVFTAILRRAIIEDCGKQVLLPNALSILQGASPDPDNGSIAVSSEAFSGLITAEYITSANLYNWNIPITDKLLAIDPEKGRFMFPGPALENNSPTVNYHYGFSGNIGAGTYDRRAVEDSEPTELPEKSGGGPLDNISNDGVSQINDSKTYGPVADITSIINMRLQAANRQRPYLRLESTWMLDTELNLNSRITLDGLWIGGKGDVPCEIILKGNYECVTICNCTLDPGGDINVLNEQLHPVSLVIEGFVEQLCIEKSITGPIVTRGQGFLETISVTDSIIQSSQPGTAAMDLGSGLVEMERVTVLGEINVHRLYASEVIITANANVTDTQTGCFRFSAAPVSSRLPKPYESFLFPNDSNHWFVSRRFGNPGYAQLSETAPEALKRGAENGSEMGAFSSLLNPIKFDGLRTKIEEYMPFGLIPLFIYET